ncbi:MAG: hypothetical protein SFW36_17540, partial [Leptolyngbyaceae cyanobacterium bins.59]|nr:hypothetical protein [Leptolyngbyaceae cyanobacterium bins.59]
MEPIMKLTKDVQPVVTHSHSLITSRGLDIFLLSLVAILSGTVAFFGAQEIHPALYEDRASAGWFESDTSRVFKNMTDPSSDHLRDKLHPLFSPIAYTVVQFVKFAVTPESISTVHLSCALFAAVWGAFFFILLRALTCRPLDALVFSSLAVTSASAIFWFTVPETYLLGSLSIISALLVAALAEFQSIQPFWYITTGAATLSITITNWMVGILAAFFHHPKRKSLMIMGASLLSVIILWYAKQFVFRSSKIPFVTFSEQAYFLTPYAGGPFHVLRSFLIHTIVMPTIEVVNRYPSPHWPIMVTQSAVPGSGSIYGAIAVGVWTGLLGLGGWAFISLQQLRKFRTILGLALL